MVPQDLHDLTNCILSSDFFANPKGRDRLLQDGHSILSCSSPVSATVN